MFVLNSRLAADTIPLGRLSLSLLLMMNDATYPWLILVPERADTRELFDLPPAERGMLMEEVAIISRMLTEEFRPDKINVAALGNIVAQLHVHVIARFRDDPAWPAAVWGRTQPRPYTAGAAGELASRFRKWLGPQLISLD